MSNKVKNNSIFKTNNECYSTPQHRVGLEGMNNLYKNSKTTVNSKIGKLIHREEKS